MKLPIAHRRLTTFAAIAVAAIAVAAIAFATVAPMRPARPADAGESRVAGYIHEARLRKLHLVRPDLISYPVSFDVVC